jgi:hypothetical protein
MGKSDDTLPKFFSKKLGWTTPFAKKKLKNKDTIVWVCSRSPDKIGQSQKRITFALKKIKLIIFYGFFSKFFVIYI